MLQTGGPPDLPGEEGLLGHVRRVPQEDDTEPWKGMVRSQSSGCEEQDVSLKAPGCLSTIHLGGCRRLTRRQSRRHRNTEECRGQSVARRLPWGVGGVGGGGDG